MENQIKQIAQRLRGLRDALDYTAAELAQICNISPSEYERYESGESDIPMSFLCTLAGKFQISPSVLIDGTEAHLASYSVTRRGQGASVERRKAYKYQALATGFKNAKSSPFEVTVEPNSAAEISQNQHSGQEFNLVLEGTLLLKIEENEILLSEGDSIYFDATKAHGMRAVGGKKVRFLAIIIE